MTSQQSLNDRNVASHFWWRLFKSYKWTENKHSNNDRDNFEFEDDLSKETKATHILLNEKYGKVNQSDH
jgi:hypothetical protein